MYYNDTKHINMNDVCNYVDTLNMSLSILTYNIKLSSSCDVKKSNHLLECLIKNLLQLFQVLICY